MVGESTSSTAVICFLCKTKVPYCTTDKTKLDIHLKDEHKALFGTDYLVSGCTMSGEERVAIQNVVSGRQPKLVQMEVTDEEKEVDRSSKSRGSIEAKVPEVKAKSTLKLGDSNVASVSKISSPKGKLKCPDCNRHSSYSFK